MIGMGRAAEYGLRSKPEYAIINSGGWLCRGRLLAICATAGGLSCRNAQVWGRLMQIGELRGRP